MCGVRQAMAREQRAQQAQHLALTPKQKKAGAKAEKRIAKLLKKQEKKEKKASSAALKGKRSSSRQAAAEAKAAGAKAAAEEETEAKAVEAQAAAEAEAEAKAEAAKAAADAAAHAEAEAESAAAAAAAAAEAESAAAAAAESAEADLQRAAEELAALRGAAAVSVQTAMRGALARRQAAARARDARAVAEEAGRSEEVAAAAAQEARHELAAREEAAARLQAHAEEGHEDEDEDEGQYWDAEEHEALVRECEARVAEQRAMVLAETVSLCPSLPLPAPQRLCTVRPPRRPCTPPRWLRESARARANSANTGVRWLQNASCAQNRKSEKPAFHRSTPAKTCVSFTAGGRPSRVTPHTSFRASGRRRRAWTSAAWPWSSCARSTARCRAARTPAARGCRPSRRGGWRSCTWRSPRPGARRAPCSGAPWSWSSRGARWWCATKGARWSC